MRTNESIKHREKNVCTLDEEEAHNIMREIRLYVCMWHAAERRFVSSKQKIAHEKFIFHIE